jgi:hypothetical protein
LPEFIATLLKCQEGSTRNGFKSKKEQLCQRAIKFKWLQLYTQFLPDSSEFSYGIIAALPGIKKPVLGVAGGRVAKNIGNPLFFCDVREGP